MPPSARSDAAANRTALLNAAARILASVGPRAPLDTITREAGVGIATFYRNFTDRDELIAALVERAVALVAEFAAEAANSSVEPLDAVRTYLMRVLDHRAQLAQLFGGPGVGTGGTMPLASPITTVLDGIIRRGVLDGTIRPDASAVDLLIAGAMLANTQLPEHAWELAARRHAQLVVDGLRARPDTTALTAPLTPVELDRALTGS